jgi:hypothetical protein
MVLQLNQIKFALVLQETILLNNKWKTLYIKIDTPKLLFFYSIIKEYLLLRK